MSNSKSTERLELTGVDPSYIRAMLVALIDPLNPTKTWSRSEEDLIAAVVKVNGKELLGDTLSKATEELERGEIVRRVSDPESGCASYRLDHDYLTRGVSAAERRANRWLYILEEAARAFEDAGTVSKKWAALLPIRTQLRLAWERVRGRFPLWQPQKFRPYQPRSLSLLGTCVLYSVCAVDYSTPNVSHGPCPEGGGQK